MEKIEPTFHSPLKIFEAQFYFITNLFLNKNSKNTLNVDQQSRWYIWLLKLLRYVDGRQKISISFQCCCSLLRVRVAPLLLRLHWLWVGPLRLNRHDSIQNYMWYIRTHACMQISSNSSMLPWSLSRAFCNLARCDLRFFATAAKRSGALVSLLGKKNGKKRLGKWSSYICKFDLKSKWFWSIYP